MKIGVLSLQGGVIEHLSHLRNLGVDCIEVKEAKDLNEINGIILPGGESTTIGLLLKERKMLHPLKERILKGLPVWGTCAGMILLAKEIENDFRKHLEVMNIKVKRNAYGSQLDSFICHTKIEKVTDKEIPLIFIRAPYIVEAGNDVDVIFEIDGKIVAAREKNMLATSFHPELSNSLEFHRYFLNMVG
ncbi:pyridoxal 5'-phosphate synthase glutaminase subunit PdxT [Caloramator sp. E03]|uniref:pyridoxal 5'-phosphate synthase glutaminase subunit PdxT n=1 Tax=Caloramator sp. E03 TaxID=2576307 RepID=UPI0011102B5D|nr:pyridoxal 5'-phosphate synthase glutaminase subunit PdxT [Caloramator sp. E03]QCX34330.1 pyridoxal 5'-phosphate synthase glutaminase subunit PdxT [Caloramator sp. E03]